MQYVENFIVRNVINKSGKKQRKCRSIYRKSKKLLEKRLKYFLSYQREHLESYKV